MRTLASSLAMASLLACATLATPARADDAGARAQFRRGVELYDKKQYADALEAFRAAYAEKPSAIIKQNIALSLLGLGKRVEAATVFDEALEEGTGALAPETRAAIERELADIAKTIATLDLHVVSAADKKPIEAAQIAIDGAKLPPGATRRPIRLLPGIHVVTAHVDGYADPPEKKLGLVAGSPVDATFEMGAAIGTVTLRPDVLGAIIKIDGAIVGPGPWTGQLTAGTHKIEVTAPDSRVMFADVVVSAGTSVDYPIRLTPAGELPPRYDDGHEAPPPPKPMRRWYLVGGLGYNGENLQLSTELGEPSSGTRRDFKGATLSLRGGYRMSRFFAAELHGEGGTLSATYTVSGDTGETTTKVTSWQVTPSLRFSTIGGVRFTTATGLGVHGMHLELSPVPGKPSRVGTTVTPSWLIDFGVQLDLSSRIYLEGLFFIDVHGVGTLRDDTSGNRLLLASPAARAGLRLGVALAF